MFSTSAIIDFLAIFPFYFSLFATDLAIVRILRLFRIFRLFRISRYSHAFRLIQSVVSDKKEELVLSTILVVFMLIIVSSIMYYIEHNAQPDKFSSIPATMWWGVTAMTTVGYGDIHPITPLGKFLGGIAAMWALGYSLYQPVFWYLVSMSTFVLIKEATAVSVAPIAGKRFRGSWRSLDQF